ncbi:unnamed protein product [Meloidogyne enterolobii]|uniref:Uncharacterized protein n=1 Tax=Meloidogyne enterolobii TaxID=390850 RepID=A0ACB0ZP98_MELEN
MKFKNSFDNKYLIKIDNEPKMHYLIKIFKEKNKKIEFASRELSEDEWQGKTEIDVKLNKAIPSYISSSKKYPMVVVVKAVSLIF